MSARQRGSARSALRSTVLLVTLLAAAAGTLADELPSQPPDSPNRIFEALARKAAEGTYPKYLLGRQTYWTVIGADGDEKEGLLNEEGMLEVDRGSFSIEPFLFTEGRLIDWSAVSTKQELADGVLPIPTVVWEAGALSLGVTAFAAGEPGSSILYARYRVENGREERRSAKLFLAIRPFQVNPPWQSLNMVGGVARIRSLSFAAPVVRVNDEKSVVALTPPDGFGAASFADGPVVGFLRRGALPEKSEIADPTGFASGALAFTLELDPGGRRDVFVAVPFHGTPLDPSTDGAEVLGRAVRFWRERLGRVRVVLPGSAAPIARTLESTVGYVLVNRDGPAIRPGSRCYERSWIRDGALTSEALLELGYAAEVREFLVWFAGYQFPDGRIPCCVDRRGADPVPENDSNGEFVFAIMEYYRHTRDRTLLVELWPNVVKAIEAIDALRRQRRTEEYRRPERLAYFGLLPESISHEGYAERPVHSYWDDFWALRGLRDAAAMAVVVGDEERAARFAVIRDEFAVDLLASIGRTMAEHGIDYVPASVELGDFDPSATSIAFDPIGVAPSLPQAALRRTYERYVEDLRERRDGRRAWQAFTPYEFRNVGALVRLGERRQAFEVLRFLFDGRRPPAWNEWAEVVWHDPTAPRFIGDMPHTWAASDFARSLRTMLVYERESDRALVLAAGVPHEWVEATPGVSVAGLSTHYGELTYRLRTDGPGALRFELSGELSPPGGIVLSPPLAAPIRSVTANGEAIDTFTADAVTIGKSPARIVIRY